MICLLIIFVCVYTLVRTFQNNNTLRQTINNADSVMSLRGRVYLFVWVCGCAGVRVCVGMCTRVYWEAIT